jgi:TRAP-type mannitol/chloroaromatic compound transport system permease small subunit
MQTANRLLSFIDTINIKVGKTVSWFTFLLVLITIYDVLMRYVFKAGTIWIQEAEWHLFAANFMLAGGWTLLRNGHVRVDLFYAKFNTKTKALIDFLGTLFFLLPFCALIVWASIPFVTASWMMLEGSPDPGGLPALYLLKTVIPVTFILIGIQGISQMVKYGYLLIKGESRS